jgi:hypothetical protein
MIQLVSVEQLRAAIERARAADLFVRPTSLSRQYKVTNRETGATYYVDFFVRKADRARFGHCTCKAGGRNIACKHLAAAAALHVGLAAIQRRLKVAS